MTQEEREIFTDIYRLYDKYSSFIGDDAGWSQLLQDVGEIDLKHKNKLCTKILVAICWYLENR